MEDLSSQRRVIGRFLDELWGGGCRVVRFRHDERDQHLDVVMKQDCPECGLTTYGTAGLHEVEISDRGLRLPTRLEIYGACDSVRTKFPNVLTTAAWCIINGGRSCHPGMVIRDCVGLYYPDARARHLLFSSPFLWGGELARVPNLGGHSVAWLFAVPVTDKEAEFVEK